MDDYRLLGLKSYDCHTLMQQLLSLEIRNCLLENVRFFIIRLCFFFNSLCYKEKLDSLSKLQKEIDTTLCNLEQCFLLAFFDVMLYLTVHLIEKFKLCGPIYLRWMYPFKREMKPIKSYVCNRNRPEGCLAE